MRDYETVWTFETANILVALELTPCPDDPFDTADADIATEMAESIESGETIWFDACVSVYRNGHRIGSDTLGACQYRDAEDFYAGHRDPDPMNRNSSIMRAARGDNVVICHYFPNMVRLAIDDARKTLAA